MSGCINVRNSDKYNIDLYQTNIQATPIVVIRKTRFRLFTLTGIITTNQNNKIADFKANPNKGIS